MAVLSINLMRTIPLVLAVALLSGFTEVKAQAAPGINEDPERWQHHMHGVLDHDAHPIQLENLSKPKDAGSIKYVEVDPESFPVSSPSSLTAIVLTRKQRVVIPQALPIDLSAVRGKKIRLFGWATAESGTRASNSYAAAPNFSLIFFSESGSQLSRTDTFAISTLGAFPWHGYYLDAHVPPDAAAIKLELKAGLSERASFTKFSWKRATESPLSSNEKQDPYTGSTASNVYYDGMTGQLRYGLGTRHTWLFLKGPRAGMKGFPFDLTTPAGLKSYFEYARTDSDEMNHGLMYFAGLYQRGRQAGVLPEGMNETWLENLTKYVIDAQDAGTGYWGSKSAPRSMGITFHFIEGLFPARGVDRKSPMPSGRPDTRRLAVTDIPRAKQIVDTTLRMQAADPVDPTRKAGWPRAAYNFTEQPNQGAQRASLAVTGNAIELLRRAEPFVDGEQKTKIYEAIKAAVLYVLASCVQADGVWRQSDTDKTPTNSWYMERVLDRSHYLEYRQNPSIPKPEVSVSKANGVLTLRWPSPLPGQNSLRVYRWRAAEPHDFDPQRLIAIAESSNEKKRTQSDPFIMCWRMGQAAQSRWGHGWRKDSYIQNRLKLASINQRTSIVSPDASFTIKANDGERIAITAVDVYGEESQEIVF